MAKYICLKTDKGCTGIRRVMNQPIKEGNIIELNSKSPFARKFLRIKFIRLATEQEVKQHEQKDK